MSKKESKTQALYRYTLLNDYKYPAHIFALDYYKPGAHGDDEFSRKEAWFYYVGDEEIKNEFSDRLEKLLKDLFVDNTIDWDYFTLAPSNEKDSLNENMEEVCDKISDKGGIEYTQVLRRSRGVEEAGEMSSVRQQITNQEGSIEITEDVEGDNIIIVDNVSVSGVYLAYITQLLLEEGAQTVCSVVLGVTNDVRDVKRLTKGTTASTAMIDLLEELRKGDSHE